MYPKAYTNKIVDKDLDKILIFPKVSTFLVQSSHFFGTYYDFWDTLYIFLKYISVDLFWLKTHENTSPVTLRKTGGNRVLKEELFGPLEKMIFV